MSSHELTRGPTNLLATPSGSRLVVWLDMAVQGWGGEGEDNRPMSGRVDWTGAQAVALAKSSWWGKNDKRVRESPSSRRWTLEKQFVVLRNTPSRGSLARDQKEMGKRSGLTSINGTAARHIHIYIYICTASSPHVLGYRYELSVSHSLSRKWIELNPNLDGNVCGELISCHV